MYEGYRQLELIVGPFKEWQGITGPGAVHIVSTGSIDTMKISASISKNIFGVDNQAEIRIWNLSHETINRLNEPGISVKLLAGYENGNMETVFQGGVLALTTERLGTDVVTNLHCLTGGSIAHKTPQSVSYTSGTSVKTIVTELARKLPGVTVDPTKIKANGTIGYSGFSASGDVTSVLNRLSTQYGFSWTIDDGIFTCSVDGQPMGTKIVLGSSSGLKKVSPQLNGRFKLQVGLDIECLYVQGVRPGNSVIIDSTLYPKYKNEKGYGIHSATWNLCPKTNQWDMSLSVLFFFGSDFS